MREQHHLKIEITQTASVAAAAATAPPTTLYSFDAFRCDDDDTDAHTKLYIDSSTNIEIYLHAENV